MTEEKPTFVDRLKAKAEEMHLKEKVEEFADQADKLTRQAAGKVGEVTHDNRDKVDGFLDKAASKVDEQTGGKYTDKIAKARQGATKGVEKLAEQRTHGGPASDTSGEAAPPASADSSPTPSVPDPSAPEPQPVPEPPPGPASPPLPDSVPEPLPDSPPSEPLPPTGGPSTGPS